MAEAQNNNLFNIGRKVDLPPINPGTFKKLISSETELINNPKTGEKEKRKPPPGFGAKKGKRQPRAYESLSATGNQLLSLDKTFAELKQRLAGYRVVEILDKMALADRFDGTPCSFYFIGIPSRKVLRLDNSESLQLPKPGDFIGQFASLDNLLAYLIFHVKLPAEHPIVKDTCYYYTHDKNYVVKTKSLKAKYESLTTTKIFGGLGSTNSASQLGRSLKFYKNPGVMFYGAPGESNTKHHIVDMKSLLGITGEAEFNDFATFYRTHKLHSRARDSRTNSLEVWREFIRNNGVDVAENIFDTSKASLQKKFKEERQKLMNSTKKIAGLISDISSKTDSDEDMFLSSSEDDEDEEIYRVVPPAPKKRKLCPTGARKPTIEEDEEGETASPDSEEEY